MSARVIPSVFDLVLQAIALRKRHTNKTGTVQCIMYSCIYPKELLNGTSLRTLLTSRSNVVGLETQKIDAVVITSARFACSIKLSRGRGQ